MGTTSENNRGLRTWEMMHLAMGVGLDDGASTGDPNTGEVCCRVIAYAGDDAGNSNAQDSEVKSVNVMLPQAEEEEPLKNFFLVGDATAAGWNPNNNNTPLFRSGTDSNLYHYTGYFGAGEFKILETTDWQPQWGLDNGTLTNSDILGGDPASFPVSAAGFYTFTMNIDEMSYSFETYDASGAATYDIIGLVGAGTSVGWPSDDNPEPDIVMTQSSIDEHIWFAQGVELTEGGMKFRANLKWDVNWGGGENFPSGIANGDDIIAQEGTYNVWFNDITGRYIFIPVE